MENPFTKLMVVPMTWRNGVEFIKRVHRHHPPARGQKFAVGVEAMTDDEEYGKVVGVAVCGRPVARMDQRDRFRFEALRVTSDGTPNVCSMLYGAVCRTAKGMGYRRGVTFILASEPGTSLKAAGWRFVRMTSGGSWSRDGRPRTDKSPTEPKQRWEWP